MTSNRTSIAPSFWDRVLEWLGFTQPKAPALSDKAKAGVVTENPVRPAGPEAMRDPPPQGEKADEASDASFPASDPPGTY